MPLSGPPDVGKLRQAVRAGARQEVRALVDTGLDVNTRDEFGGTMLYLAAAICGDTEMTALLLELGAEATMPEAGELETPLHGAANKGHTEIAALLLKAGADLEARNKSGETPLRDAAYYGRTEMAELLLDNGADVNAHDDQKRTPLHWAAERGRTDRRGPARRWSGRERPRHPWQDRARRCGVGPGR